MNDWTPLSACVACGGMQLKQYLNLGEQPLANSFHDGTKELPRFPLGLNLCLSCGHSQNLGVVNPSLIFEDYLYVSGTSQTLRDYFSWFVTKVESDMPKRSLTVLEIASNDGTLLQKFAERGHYVWGVDPAKNIESPVPTYRGYWDAEAASELKGPWDVIVAMNVLGHVADPAKFLRLCKKVLAPKGRIYVQVSQANMVEDRQFDTVYHEHVSFFTNQSLFEIGKRAELEIIRAEISGIHGGSFLYQFAHGNPISGNNWPQIDWRYSSFQFDAASLVTTIGLHVERAQDDGFAVVGVGAAAKAMTVLNFGRIKLDYIVDENALKIGKLTPGMDIPVVAPERLFLESRQCFFIFLAWNFVEELERKVKEWRQSTPKYDALYRSGEDIGFTYFPIVKQWAIEY